MEKETNDYQYAGFWVRTGACLIDTLLICLVTYPILIGIYGMEYFSSEELIVGSWDFLFTL